MGSLCFSAASILRCESFTALESQILIIPTALELIFSTTLIITNWGTGWRHLLLAAEGWSYFALALLELLSHTIPAVRDSVTVFSIVDIVLGATSFLPIFFYTLFVYLFTRGELIDTLPQRFQRVANVLLVFFIPAIIALNELSSFVGISRRTIVTGGRAVVAIGFTNTSDQTLWTFLTSLTLALLTAFEAINFCFAFYRLVRAFVDQRRIETTSSDQAHLIRGIGWIAGGFKLGAVETVIGFAQGGGFGGALTRRIVRFLARAFLIIGIVKGVDQFDDFDEVTKEMSSGRQQFRRSRLGMMISNPRFSTFRQLSPTATDFRTLPTVQEKEADPAKPSMATFAALKRDVTMRRSGTRSNSNGLLRPNQRVTVHFDEGAPTLHMRFSGLDMPSPAVIAESVKARPVSSSWVSIARSSRYAPSMSTVPSFAFDPPALPAPTTYPEFIFDRGQPPLTAMYSRPNSRPGSPPQEQMQQHTRGLSEFSRVSSNYRESLSTMHELTSQFPVPGLPPSVPTTIEEASGWGSDVESQRNLRRSWEEDAPYRAPERRSPSNNNPGAVPSPDAVPMRYAYGGMEYPESPEPVFRYAYDGPISPEREREHVDHPYAHAQPIMQNPHSPVGPRHRTVRSDTTLGNTPMAFLSPFADEGSTSSTPGTEDPFEYDDSDVGVGKAVYVQRQEAVYMRDGPRGGSDWAGEDGGGERTSAALLQMTQRGDGGVHAAWTPPEFTPSMLSLAPTAASETSSVRRTLKKRRPSRGAASIKDDARFPAAASVDTFASSWLHGDMDAEDDEHGGVPVPVRVKSVGRVRAPTRATPAPVSVRHATRGSVYIQPITVPPAPFSSEVQIVQGGSSADSYSSEFGERRTMAL